jgi:hypothetical protein
MRYYVHREDVPMQSQEQRIAELESELRQRDHYIVELVGELDAARELIERMEKNVEDCIRLSR